MNPYMPITQLQQIQTSLTSSVPLPTPLSSLDFWETDPIHHIVYTINKFSV